MCTKVKQEDSVMEKPHLTSKVDGGVSNANLKSLSI